MTEHNDYQNQAHEDTSAEGKPSESVHVSNRAYIPPTSDHPAGRRHLHEVIGIDYLSCSFPVFPPGPELDHADRADFHNEGKVRSIRNLTFEAVGITVSLRVAPGRDGWTAKARFNPSEFTGNPDPTHALPLASLPAAASAVWITAQEFVAPRVALAEVTITRIDLARDFRVEPVAQVALLEALRTVPIPYARWRPLFSSSRGVPQSLYAGTRKGSKVRIYDRHAKDRTVPAGTLRVEVEAKKNWASRYGGIKVLADISPASVTDLFLNRFGWCGAGLPVTYEVAWLQRLWDLTSGENPTISRLEAVRFAGVERFQRTGIIVPESNSARRAGNALRAALGATHASLDAPSLLRLDPAYDEPLRTAA